MTTHALPPLPEPLKEVAVAGYHDGTLRPAMEEYFDADQMRAYAIAALSALPADGGNEDAWRGLYRLERAMRFMDNNAELTRERAYKMADDDVAAMEKQLATTPQPSAAEDRWDEAEKYRICQCGQGFIHEVKDCRADAAVGAQGDGQYLPVHVSLIREIERVGTRCLDSGKCHHRCIKTCSRRNGCVPLSIAGSYLNDDWTLKAAAPAAGKGVDDAMVERACAESWPEARFTVEAMTDWPHADPLRRGHHQRVVRAALEAALTRQPATCECAQCRRNRALYNRDSPFAMEPLPERDDSKPNSEQGLYRKFDVRRTDGSDEPGGKHHGCEYFVLDVKHDPLAKAALAGYADAAEATHPQLAAELRERYSLTRQPVAGDGMVLVSARQLQRVHSALSDSIGDTDPYVAPDATDDEVRTDEPVLWACQQISMMLAAPIGPAQVDGWIAVSDRLPDDGALVMVYAPQDGGRIDFDGREEGVWVEHYNAYEHFIAVGGSHAGGPDCVCVGPSEDAPYTHWQPLPAAPAATPTDGGEVP